MWQSAGNEGVGFGVGRLVGVGAGVGGAGVGDDVRVSLQNFFLKPACSKLLRSNYCGIPAAGQGHLLTHLLVVMTRGSDHSHGARPEAGVVAIDQFAEVDDLPPVFEHRSHTVGIHNVDLLKP
jgi:hypothetical protein